MSHYSFLKSRVHSRFASPLAGMVYDNKQFEQSVFFSRHENHKDQFQSTCSLTTAKTTPSTLHKMGPRQHRSTNPEIKSQMILNNSKVMQLSKRLSNPSRGRCTRNRWASDHSSTEIQEGYARRTMKNALRLDSELSTSLIKADKVFKYPELRVYALDTLGQTRGDLKVLKLQLKRYFDAFVKSQLMGSMFQDLADLIERNLDDMIQSCEKTQVEQSGSNSEKYTFSNKKALYQKLSECERLGRLKQLYNLLKLYCIPSINLRQIFLQDVLSLLKIQLYQQFGLSNDKEYVLMGYDGVVITDFTMIKFSTKKLFVVDGARAGQMFKAYLDVISNRHLNSSKDAFRETLKVNFRQELGKELIDDTPSSPKSNLQNMEDMRSNVSRAQRIINFKKDKSSFGRGRLIQFLNRPAAIKRSTSKSPITRESHRPQDQKGFVSMQDKMTQQFRQLKRSNDYQNAQFKNDETCKNKLQLGILVRENVYFQSKTDEQNQKVLCNFRLIEEGEKFQDYRYKTITLQQFIFMRKVINCSGGRRNIVQFVDRYLGYDEYGQLQKDDLQEVLSFVIGGQGKTSKIILMIVWSWLQKNGVITNDILRRSNMQLQYERNKVVYYFIISLIFGTNDTTALELAQEVLV